MSYNLTLSPQEVQLVMTILDEHPRKVVKGVCERIESQIIEQNKGRAPQDTPAAGRGEPRPSRDGRRRKTKHKTSRRPHRKDSDDVDMGDLDDYLFEDDGND